MPNTEIADRRMGPNSNGPAKDWSDVAKSDTVNFAELPIAIWVGTVGDVAAVAIDGSVSTFKNVPSGTLMVIRPVRINSTNTTAADMVALF